MIVLSDLIKLNGCWSGIKLTNQESKARQGFHLHLLNQAAAFKIVAFRFHKLVCGDTDQGGLPWLVSPATDNFKCTQSGSGIIASLVSESKIRMKRLAH